MVVIGCEFYNKPGRDNEVQIAGAGRGGLKPAAA